MKTKLLSLALIVALIGCSESKVENKENSTEGQNKETVNTDASVDADKLQLDLVSSIVTKGGAKAADQVLIEQMLSNVSETKNLTTWESKAVGNWVGKFGNNKINISLTRIKDGKVEGFSVCAGNFRKIEGEVSLKENGYHFTMNEPGNDKYDGSFDFTIDPDFSVMFGTWTPFKKEGNTSKKYELNQKEFAYNATIGAYPNTSTKLLTYEDVENLMPDELGYMRNEIYARHGYSFKNKEWRYEFEQKDWYLPMGVDIRDQLTEIEIENIGLIYEYESYFDEYYDDYGR